MEFFLNVIQQIQDDYMYQEAEGEQYYDQTAEMSEETMYETAYGPPVQMDEYQYEQSADHVQEAQCQEVDEGHLGYTEMTHAIDTQREYINYLCYLWQIIPN